MSYLLYVKVLLQYDEYWVNVEWWSTNGGRGNKIYVMRRRRKVTKH